MRCPNCGGIVFRKTKMLKEEIEFWVCNKCDWIGNMVDGDMK